MTGIYMILNKKNNKVYIGQSIDVDKRLRKHIKDLEANRHCNKHIQDAWNKYGKQNFEFIILEKCSIDKLNELEEYYIFCFDSCDYKKGYNMTYGGEGGIKTEEVKQKLRKPKPPRSKEHNEKIRKSMLGKTPWNKGKKTSEEVRQKQRNAKLGKPAHNRKMVMCINTGEVFESSVEAAKSYNICSTNIRKCCRSERPYAGGLSWEYV